MWDFKDNQDVGSEAAIHSKSAFCSSTSSSVLVGLIQLLAAYFIQLP
jgi:hypothetical protein